MSYSKTVGEKGRDEMRKIKLGVVTQLEKNKDVHEQLQKIIDYGFETCQLICWDEELLNDKYADIVNAAVKSTGIDITAFWCGWQGPAVWNFYEGPVTLGLVPPDYRIYRIQTLIKGAEFTQKIGVPDMATHAGFIPENPCDTNYFGVVSALKYIAENCKSRGLHLLLETGQETPITLKRVIQDTGCDNLGINFDPANLLMYGKANPIEALDIIGRHVRGVHAKDGIYPSDGRFLGEEKPLGEGKVNFPAFILKLKEIGYQGALTIEREISGEKQIKDILAAKKLLEVLI